MISVFLNIFTSTTFYKPIYLRLYWLTNLRVQDGLFANVFEGDYLAGRSYFRSLLGRKSMEKKRGKE